MMASRLTAHPTGSHASGKKGDEPLLSWSQYASRLDFAVPTSQAYSEARHAIPEDS